MNDDDFDEGEEIWIALAFGVFFFLCSLHSEVAFMELGGMDIENLLDLQETHYTSRRSGLVAAYIYPGGLL